MFAFVIRVFILGSGFGFRVGVLSLQSKGGSQRPLGPEILKKDPPLGLGMSPKPGPQSQEGPLGAPGLGSRVDDLGLKG